MKTARDTMKSRDNIDPQVTCNEKRSFDHCSNCSAEQKTADNLQFAMDSKSMNASNQEIM